MKFTPHPDCFQEASIEAQEFEKAASLRDKERKLTQKKRELEENWRTEEGNTEQPEIGRASCRERVYGTV